MVISHGNVPIKMCTVNIIYKIIEFVYCYSFGIHNNIICIFACVWESYDLCALWVMNSK